MRKLDERIMKEESKIEYVQHKFKTSEMMKMWVDKMSAPTALLSFGTYDLRTGSTANLLISKCNPREDFFP
jgi:hypothetical protein